MVPIGWHRCRDQESRTLLHKLDAIDSQELCSGGRECRSCWSVVVTPCPPHCGLKYWEALALTSLSQESISTLALAECGDVHVASLSSVATTGHRLAWKQQFQNEWLDATRQVAYVWGLWGWM